MHSLRLENIMKSNPYDVLVIDNDRATIKLVTIYLESKGYPCKGVVSGAKGLKKAKKHVLKVILEDVCLLDISRYEIC